MTNTNSTTLYANPYNLDASGFYFDTADEFEQLARNHVCHYGLPVEEYEVDYIDGPDAELFRACEITQANLKLWEEIEGLEDYQKPTLFYCLNVLGM